MANTTGKKYGGRQKGTPNRMTKELRTVLKDLLYTELTELTSILDSLEQKDRLEIIIKLLPYVLPKVRNVGSKEDEPCAWPIHL